MAEQQGQGVSQPQPDRKTGTTAKNGKSTSNAKDPLRPRRKKAKRACFACQRAHLTCGMYICDLFVPTAGAIAFVYILVLYTSISLSYPLNTQQSEMFSR